MSSAQSTDGVELDPETTEGPAGAPDGALEQGTTESDANTPVSGEKPRWLRKLGPLGRLPIEVYILTVVAAVTRFAGLYDPRAIVFDELYFREYALHYHVGTYYFDLHPPLGKLLIGIWGMIAGVSADPMGKDPAVVLRAFPALAGTALIISVYYLIRLLCNSRRVATLGAALVMLDNAILAESRLTLIDSTLLFFGITSVVLMLAARKRTGRAYWLLFIGSGLLAGAAITTKLTGVSALGLIGLIWLADVVNEKRWKTWKPLVGQLAALAIAPAVIYVATFAIHFALLPKSGGTADLYMSQQFQQQLKGNAGYNPDVHMSFVDKFADLNKSIHTYELSLNGSTHPYASKWWSWPYMKRGVYLYVKADGWGKTSSIYTIGNPFVWWGTLVGVAVVLAGILARPKRFARVKWPLILLFVAWVANYLPFIAITRPMFLYHYFFALIFSVAFVVIGLGALLGWLDEGPRPFRIEDKWPRIAYWGILGGALLMFLFFAPITYGLPLTEQGLDHRMWFTSWR